MSQEQGCPRLEAKGSQQQRPHQAVPRRVHYSSHDAASVQDAGQMRPHAKKTRPRYHFGPALAFTFSVVVLGAFLAAVLFPAWVAGLIGWHRTLLFCGLVAYASCLVAVWSWTEGGAT
jgi:hypothetical protein